MDALLADSQDTHDDPLPHCRLSLITRPKMFWLHFLSVCPYVFKTKKDFTPVFCPACCPNCVLPNITISSTSPRDQEEGDIVHWRVIFDPPNSWCPLPLGYQISWQSWRNPDQKWPNILTFLVLQLINCYQTGYSWCAQEFQVPLKKKSGPRSPQGPPSNELM